MYFPLFHAKTLCHASHIRKSEYNHVTQQNKTMESHKRSSPDTSSVSTIESIQEEKEFVKKEDEPELKRMKKLASPNPAPIADDDLVPVVMVICEGEDMTYYHIFLISEKDCPTAAIWEKLLTVSLNRACPWEGNDETDQFGVFMEHLHERGTLQKPNPLREKCLVSIGPAFNPVELGVKIIRVQSIASFF